MRASRPNRLLRAAAALAAAVSGWGVVWFLIQASAGGDYLHVTPFASVMLLVVPLAFAVVGYLAGESRPGQLAVGVMLCLALYFFFIVPDGWWASGPPMPEQVSPPPGP